MTREIFWLKRHPQYVVEKLVPDLFIKKSKLNIYLDHQSEMLQSFFIVFRSRDLPKYIKTKALQLLLPPIKFL